MPVANNSCADKLIYVPWRSPLRIKGLVALVYTLSKPFQGDALQYYITKVSGMAAGNQGTNYCYARRILISLLRYCLSVITPTAALTTVGAERMGTATC